MSVTLNINENRNEYFQFRLSPRQSEVLLMISNGYTNKDIATALEISPETVKSHLKVIFRRTNIHKRTQAKQLLGWPKAA